MMLQIENLSVSFGNKKVVDDVSFGIEKGECVALVGESGSGKTMTALSVLRLVQGAETSGRVLWNGEDLNAVDDNRLREIRGAEISMVFQEPMTSLNPLHSIGDQVAEAITLHHRVSSAELYEKTVSLLESVGFRDAAARLDDLPHRLSGGERQRVMIAQALANNPGLLIADEPTTALDVTIQAQIIELLRFLKHTLKLSVLFISHDLNLVRKIADRVCVMKGGQIVETGTVADIFIRPEHPYTKTLVNAVPPPFPARTDDAAPVLLSAEDVVVPFVVRESFFGKPEAYFYAVAGVDLAVRKGQTVALVGESGSGKSTLSQALLKLVDYSGKITFDGRDLSTVKGAEMRALRRRIQIVFQDPFASLSPRMTVEQIIGEGLEIHAPHLKAAERHVYIVQALRDVGLDESVLERYPHAFSGGQRQRIAIARTLVLRPDLIILDEPTSALDVSVQGQILFLLQDLQRRYGMAYLFISHDMRAVRSIADVVYVMRNGKIVESGKNKVIFKKPKQAYTADLMAAAFDFTTHGGL